MSARCRRRYCSTGATSRVNAYSSAFAAGPEAAARSTPARGAESRIVESGDLGARRRSIKSQPLTSARPLARVIQEYLKKPLAEEVLFGKLSQGGGTVRVDTKGEGAAQELAFTFLPPERDALPPASQEPVLAE